MSTYSQDDYEAIATAIGKDIADVMRHANSFEAAAVWYRSDNRAPKSPNRIAPSTISKKMTQIANAARKLSRHLEIHDPREADDGPGAIALLEYLASASDNDEDAVMRATGRVGRLVEIFEAIDAIRELEHRTEKATEDALQVGKLIVPQEHQGDAAVNGWVAAMMSLYKRVTGKEPGTSVRAPGSASPRKAAGPLIRFLEAAGKPLKIEQSPESWRGRVRLLNATRKK
ncbi:MAG: hypothetical protein R3D30_13960 [Hyphomicrobiales bacterium]